MKNFSFHTPTKILFGKGQIENLGKEIKPYAKKVLLAYGGGSVKKIGLYDKTISILKENGIEFVELSGIEPNPKIESVRDGVKLCREATLCLDERFYILSYLVEMYMARHHLCKGVSDTDHRHFHLLLSHAVCSPKASRSSHSTTYGCDGTS